MRAVLAALGVLALAASASAATLKVPQQYGTIQEAVNAAADGDVIVVSKGVYYESVYVGIPNLRILGKKAVMDGTFESLGLTVQGPSIGYYNLFNVEAPGVTIQGFTFRNGSTHVNIAAPGCRVLKCVSRNPASNGVNVSGYDGTEVSANRFVGSGYTAVNVSGNASVITKNSVQQAGSYGIQVNGSGAVVDGNRVSTVGDSFGIYVNSSAAVVSRNTVSNTGNIGLYVNGVGVAVTGNRVSWASRAPGILVSGGQSLIQGNTVTVASNLLLAYGSGNRVLDNRVSWGTSDGMQSTGFMIGGDDLTVTGNSAQQIAGNGTGFYIYNYGSAQTTTIADNTAEDVAGYGFQLTSVYGASVSGCRAIRCGTYPYHAGFYVYGEGATFTDCSATDCHGNGFFVGAQGDSFTSCTAMGATVNGFLVYGSGNSFTSCSARDAGGQGFHNEGTGTTLSGGVYLDNRIDITNRVSNMASFLGGLGSVLYETGGETTEPEVFYPE